MTLISWVTMTMVTLKRLLMSSKHSKTLRVVAGSRAEVGSVGENDLGLGCERAGDADALFLSAGKLGGVVVGAFGQADDFKAFFNAFFDFFRRPSGDFQRKGNIVGDGAIAQKIELLKHHADILPRLTQCGGIKRGQLFVRTH